ncbi:MAG: Flp pilus assembly complex ATPase component TadA [Deltaproteobacteria bacterium]|jgi:twitching motility protein PilT|nr:Flp pilus assembly complex ATPase component TadA [Deltaproteobacteria bacterium]
MPTLSDFEFSDLILTEGDPATWFFKGAPDHSLTALDQEMQRECGELLGLLKNSYEGKSSSLSLRVEFADIPFRVAVYNDFQRGRVFFLRRLPKTIPGFHELGFLDSVANWLMRKELTKGLVLIAGPQASGKTTVASAYVAARLKAYNGHAITYEHPVEMPLAGPHGEAGFCYQNDIESEADLPGHIERSHRYGAPNIIFIGEIRTKYAASEVLRIALGSSQQLVVATTFGSDLKAALERLLTWAKELDGEIAQHNLSQTLLACVHQELLFDQKTKTKTLNVKEFLLLPFDERSDPIRAKIRDGNLYLADHIRDQKSQILYGLGDFK